MQKQHILWADDEIDLLRPHILFLSAKGYEVTGVPSGADALERCAQGSYDLVFLDENMPGMSGLETLSQIKAQYPGLPVVMITKSEEEYIMESAIGRQIADYLIKPLNPNQILLSVKRILDNRRLVQEATTQGYQQEFRQLAMTYSDRLDHDGWADVYRKLIYWELEIDRTQNRDMMEMLSMQKEEAGRYFCEYIEERYEDWLEETMAPTGGQGGKPNKGGSGSGAAKAPTLSHKVLADRVLPLTQGKEATEGPLFLVVIDNLRMDQWKVLQPALEEAWSLQEESHYYSILPTATGFARNAIFSGLLPSEMAKRHPDLWVGDDEEEGKNNHEEAFLRHHLDRLPAYKGMRFSYHKILTTEQGRALVDRVPQLMDNPLNVIVYNFVDMLSHARTETAMIRELAPDEPAYRSLTRSWFTHSPLAEILRRIAERGGRVVITTDHGTMLVRKPFKIVGDRAVNTNLRYKQGKNLGFDEKDSSVMVVRKPERLYLPKPNVSTAYVFAKQESFFAYPNNYNHYVSYYRDTFQHGGISMEEMIIPLVYLKPR